MTYGFIGTGNMGGALARALVKTVSPTDIFLNNRTMARAEALAAELGAHCADAETIVSSCGCIFLGVKPHLLPGVLAQLRPTLTAREDKPLLVSMAAGLTIADIQKMAGGSYPVIRIMPNTPAAIGEGMILYTCGDGVTKAEEKLFLDAMAGAGRLAAIPEGHMDVGAAVSGCGPAFVDLFLEAMADGGVACGLPRAQALEFAAQMMVGSARLVLESGKHPGALKDAVCSPAGSTIQGVRTLETAGFRGAVMEAVIAAYEKSKALR